MKDPREHGQEASDPLGGEKEGEKRGGERKEKGGRKKKKSLPSIFPYFSVLVFRHCITTPTPPQFPQTSSPNDPLLCVSLVYCVK